MAINILDDYDRPVSITMDMKNYISLCKEIDPNIIPYDKPLPVSTICLIGHSVHIYLEEFLVDTLRLTGERGFKERKYRKPDNKAVDARMMKWLKKVALL